MKPAFFQQRQSEAAKITSHNYTLRSEITGTDLCFVNRTLSCLQILYQLEENLTERLFRIAVTAQKLDASIANIDDVKSCLYQKTTTFVEENIQDIFFNNASQACTYIPDFINGLRGITKTTPLPNHACIKIGTQMQREIAAVCKQSASVLVSASDSLSRSRSLDATPFTSKSRSRSYSRSFGTIPFKSNSPNKTSTETFRSSISQSYISSKSTSQTLSLSASRSQEVPIPSSSDGKDTAAITAGVASSLILVTALFSVLAFRKYRHRRQHSGDYMELIPHALI